MGRLTSGYRYCPVFVKDFFEKMSSSSTYVDAIRSGRVQCTCAIDRKLADPRHDGDCRWQRYVEEIYRIGRDDDEKNSTPMFASALRERGAALSVENQNRRFAQRGY